MIEEIIWQEKYRPHKLDDIIGHEDIIKRLKVNVERKSIQHLLFSGPPGCVSGNSVIFTNKGLLTIKEIYEEHNMKKIGYIKVACSDRNSSMEFKDIEEYHMLKDKEVIKIITKFGYEIICTPEHKIVSVDKDGMLGFVEAKDIHIDDSVPILYGAYCFGENTKMRFDEGQGSLINYFYDGNLKNELCNNIIGTIEYGNNAGGQKGKACTYPYMMNEELAEYLGYFISEGNIDSGTVNITNTDKKINERTNYLSNKLFGLESSLIIEVRKENEEYGRKVSSVGLVTFLNRLGLDKKSNEKHVPIEILRSSKEVHITFLRALYDGDGYVTKEQRHLGYSSMSKQLCKQVQLMLLNLGIFSSLNEKDAYCNGKYCGKTYDTLIYGKDILKFRDIIGFNLEYRKNDLDMICEGVEEKGTYTQRTLKGLGVYLDKIYEEFKKLGRMDNIREYYMFEGVRAYNCYTAKDALLKRGEKDIHNYITEKRMPTKEKLYNILIALKECNYMDEYKYLMNLCELNVEYDYVESIERRKEDVYDLTIKDLHHYIANGFIVHNSGKTTAAIALAKEIFGASWLSNFKELNASDDRGIDVIRVQVKDFAMAKSLGGTGFKIILLDEADALCLDEETEIVIGKKSTKRIIKVKDIPTDGYIDIPSVNISSHKIENDAGKCIDSGNVDMFKITLENGKEIIASSEHPFFRLNNEGEIIEVKVKELNEESKILDFAEDINIVQCEICNKNIIKQASTRKVRYCSVECKNKGHSIEMVGERNSMFSKDAWNKGKTKIDDERIAKQGHLGDTNCSKRPEVNEKRSKSLKNFYETEEGKQLAKDLGQHLSETKKGKTYKELFPNLSNEQLEELRKQRSSTYRKDGIFKESNYRKLLLGTLPVGTTEVECNICHEIIKIGKQDGIYVHHKDGNHNNNEKENLEFACPRCHNLECHDTMNNLIKGWEILRGE